MDSPLFSEAPTTGGLDNRLIAAMRLVLSSSVLFIIAPSDLDEPGVFQILSALYTAYSVFLYALAVRQAQPLPAEISYWADVIWIALLTWFSNDTNTAFLFLFPIVLAAF